MGMMKMMVDIISVFAGIVSIILAVYAIIFAKKESRQSSDNYYNTKELLKEIEHKAELIDRGIQFEQEFLMKIVNSLLEKSGKEQIESSPLSIEEIDRLIDGKAENEKVRIDELEKAISKIPKIHISSEEPKTLPNGATWIKCK